MLFVTSLAARPVRSAPWWLLVLLGIACGSRPLRMDAGHESQEGAAGADGGSYRIAGSSGAAGLGMGGASGSLGGGGRSSAGSGGGNGMICQGVVLYGLSVGDSCFDIVSVAAGAADGCSIGVADAAPNGGLVGSALPFNYDTSTATVTIGSMASLGSGEVLCNEGTLTHDAFRTLDTMPACSWHQTDMSLLHLTATNELDLSVTEVENAFTGCSTADTPPGGSCTSTWTWHMKKGLETPPSCQ
jgi:hypothetical protein